jgi:hypothetical protein
MKKLVLGYFLGVDKAGSCRQLRGQEAEKFVESIPPWYKDPELDARPPAL